MAISICRRPSPSTWISTSPGACTLSTCRSSPNTPIAHSLRLNARRMRLLARSIRSLTFGAAWRGQRAPHSPTHPADDYSLPLEELHAPPQHVVLLGAREPGVPHQPRVRVERALRHPLEAVAVRRPPCRRPECAALCRAPCQHPLHGGGKTG